MEQKDYKLEIINELLKNDNHVRSLAKNLGTNHMSISRKIQELMKENIVDFKEIGKNKTYFLKKNLESRNCVLNAELYKLTRLLQKYPELKGVIEKIQKEKGIKLALLFGSYAKETANSKSDIDVYIESNNKNLKKELEMINSKLSIKLGRYDKKSLLIKEIEKYHVIIKGVELYYERNKFFD